MHEHKLLDLVLDVEPRGLVVEPVLLLEHEGAVDGEGEAHDYVEHVEGQDEQEGNQDLVVSGGEALALAEVA